MSTSFNRFVTTQAIATAAFNAAVNASFAWWLWSPRATLPLSGAGSIGVDLAATPAVIAVLSALLGTAFIRQKLHDGRVAAPRMAVPAVLHASPRGLAQRTVVFGLLAAALFSLPMWSAIQASGVAGLSLADRRLLAGDRPARHPGCPRRRAEEPRCRGLLPIGILAQFLSAGPGCSSTRTCSASTARSASPCRCLLSGSRRERF